MGRQVNKLGQQILDSLLPQQCALCGLASQNPLPLCQECEAELSANTAACCRCAIPLPPASIMAENDDRTGVRIEARAENRTGNLIEGQIEKQVPEEILQRWCGDCLSRPPPYAHVIAPWLYSEYMGHLIHRWKYSGDFGMTPLLAHLWQQRAQPTPVDALIPVPLHWWRQWRRGFNQSELLAQRLRRICPELSSCAIDTQLLKRHRATAVQSGSNARERARNLRGAFTVTRPCDNLRIAVIDDVLTTGATATEIARTLTNAGASHIEIWCIARTPAPGA